MSDGAQMGVGAERALESILGDAPQPTDEERQSADEMRAEILATTTDPQTYNGTAMFVANRILNWLIANPERAHEPTELVYDWNGDPDHGSEGLKPEYVIAQGWHELMKADGMWPEDTGLTGFMWGWAVNAARRCVELPEVPNPAIMEI